MWTLRKPTDADLVEFLLIQRGVDYSYSDVGATTRDDWPKGFDHDRNRVLLGRGEEIFRRARSAISQWQHFPTSWTRIVPANAPIATGTTVALVVRALGVWWLNSVRIVYVIDEAGPTPRFGFAYGTLPAHVEKGEEQFLVTLDKNDDVCYSISAFSRPRMVAARLGYPIVRRLQRRFVLESFRQMSLTIRRI